MKWWPCMMKRKCEPDPHLKRFRLSWDKTREEKISTLVRCFSYFWSSILRGCGVCDAFAVLLSEPMAWWLSRGDLKPSIFAVSSSSSCLSGQGRALRALWACVGPCSLGFVFQCPAPCACGLPSCIWLCKCQNRERAASPGVLVHLRSRVSGWKREQPLPPLPWPWFMGLPSRQAPQHSPDQHNWYWYLFRHKMWHGGAFPLPRDSLSCH